MRLTNRHIPGHWLRRLLLTLIDFLLLLLAVRRVAEVAGVEAERPAAVISGAVQCSDGFEDLGGKVADVGDLTLRTRIMS